MRPTAPLTRRRKPLIRNLKEARIRDEADELVAEAEKYVGPLNADQKRIAYEICKEANRCRIGTQE